MTIDGLLGGLIFSVNCLLAHGVVDNGYRVIKHLWLRRAPNPKMWRCLSTALICGGILSFGGLQVYDRSMPSGVPSSVREYVTLQTWLLILSSILVGQTAIIAEHRSKEVGSWWLRIMLGGVIVTTLAAAGAGVFHAPIYQ